MKVIVTGANGFVGRRLIPRLIEDNYYVVAALRHPSEVIESDNLQAVKIDDLGKTDVPKYLFESAHLVVHLASRVHVMSESSGNPLEEYRRVNVYGTLSLARTAAAAGVKRFVFISSVKVNGEATAERPINHLSEDAPSSPYGLSKWEAEQGLKIIALETGMEVVIIRPPLVYGPKVGANFLRLMRLVGSGVPLPLASINNRRSMVYLGNLVDLIRVCLTHPDAAGETFLAADGEDVSTPELMRRLATAMGVKARLFSFPPSLLSISARCIGKGAEADRLIGSLQVDASHAFQRLNWQPPFTLDQGLQETADWYLQNRAQ